MDRNIQEISIMERKKGKEGFNSVTEKCIQGDFTRTKWKEAASISGLTGENT